MAVAEFSEVDSAWSRLLDSRGREEERTEGMKGEGEGEGEGEEETEVVEIGATAAECGGEAAPEASLSGKGITPLPMEPDQPTVEAAQAVFTADCSRLSGDPSTADSVLSVSEMSCS